MINIETKNFNINNIETILFDKDGTLIDLHYFWGKISELRIKKIIENYNLDNNLFYELTLKLGYDIHKQKMLPDGITALYSRSKIIEIFSNDLNKININVTKNDLENIFDNVSEEFHKNMFNYIKPIESAFNFIKLAHKFNINLGIITSDSTETTNLTLKHLNWEKYFKIAIGRESHPDTKESGKPTIMALEKLKANPKTTIMIGDAPMDYLSAKNAGIEKTILVATGQISLEELSKTSPYCINSLNEIKINQYQLH